MRPLSSYCSTKNQKALICAQQQLNQSLANKRTRERAKRNKENHGKRKIVSTLQKNEIVFVRRGNRKTTNTMNCIWEGKAKVVERSSNGKYLLRWINKGIDGENHDELSKNKWPGNLLKRANFNSELNTNEEEAGKDTYFDENKHLLNGADESEQIGDEQNDDEQNDNSVCQEYTNNNQFLKRKSFSRKIVEIQQQGCHLPKRRMKNPIFWKKFD